MSKTPAQRRGRWAESIACTYLQQQGLILVQRNYHCRFGEIDLIMHDDDTLVFVEVRYRRRLATAAESIIPAKQRRLCTAGAHYLSTRTSQPCRFDAVLVAGAQARPQVEWLSAAFDDVRD